MMENKIIEIDNLSIFYRQAGNPKKETILFLHGMPSSSHMYRNIIKGLEDKFHLIAPDYPGFGYSEIPAISKFEYTFDSITKVIEKFIEKLNLKNIYLCMQDYGGPIGFRIAKSNPNNIKGLIIQNANIYEEGIGPAVQEMGNLMTNGTDEDITNGFKNFFSPEGIKFQYLNGAKNLAKIDPISYLSDIALFSREGVFEVQKKLFLDYASNFPKYSEWQSYLKEYQPKTIVIWGGNDIIFTSPGAHAYKNHLKEVEIHILEGGHFVLEEYYQEANNLITDFLQKKNEN